MKAILILIGLVIVAGVGYTFLSDDTTPTATETNITPTETTEAEELPTVEEVAETEGFIQIDSIEEPVEEPVGVTEDTNSEPESTERVFTIDAFSYGYSESEIRVNEGDTVTINLTNSDGLHDWVVAEFAAATDIIREGETSSVTFVADQAGTFEYYCSVGSHRAQGMVGTLIVE